MYHSCRICPKAKAENNGKRSRAQRQFVHYGLAIGFTRSELPKKMVRMKQGVCIYRHTSVICTEEVCRAHVQQGIDQVVSANRVVIVIVAQEEHA